jgi:Uma2 family endonuclease
VGQDENILNAVRTTMTMEEFLALPELPAGKRELLRGELIELPSPKDRHNEIAHLLYEALNEAVSACQIGGKVRMEKGYDLSARHWLKPDVSITHPHQPVRDYALGAPLLAVEVISESNTADEIDAKIEDYLAHGAAEVWIVYPDRRHMWVFRPGITGECHSGKYCSPLLAAQIIDLDRIFA